MISTGELRKGVAIELDGDLWQILDYHHIKMGRGSAQVRITLRNIKRGQTVEPMQGVVKDLFALERCWMHGYRNNRWLFAAMGVTVQIHQARALKRQRSVWKIKQEILGL